MRLVGLVPLVVLYMLRPEDWAALTYPQAIALAAAFLACAAAALELGRGR